MSGGAAVFALGDLLVVISAASLVAGLRLPGLLDRLVAFGTLAVTQIELSLLISGAGFESLRRPTVLLVNVLLTAAALAYGHRDLRAWIARSWRSPDLLARLARSPWATALVALAAAEVLWRLFLAVVLPPFAYDAIAYHLTTTAGWIQQGKLVTNPFYPCCAHYPLNTELIFAWPALLLGDDTLVDAVQIGFAVLGALAVAGIGRVAGLSKSGAAAAGAMFFLTPLVLAQSNTAYVDIAFASMFLCGLYMVLRYVLSEPRTGYLGLGGLATGYAVGSKGTGALYAAVLLLVVLAGVSVRRWARSPRAAPTAVVVVFAAGLLATGGYWYGRNLVDRGNPVYPFAVKVAGVQIFSGARHVTDILTNPVQYHGESNWVRVLHSWFHDARPTRGDYGYGESVGGFGIVWPWMMLPALVAFTAFAVRRRRDLLFALIVPMAAIFLLQPYEWWSRFTLFLPALGAVALVHVIERARGAARVGLELGSVVLVLVGAALATSLVVPEGKARPISAVHVIRLAFGPGRERTLGRLFFPEYAWLDAIPRHTAIDVGGGEEPRFIYPLFGPTFSRPVHALYAESARLFDRQLSDDRAGYVFVEQGSLLDRIALHDAAVAPIYRDNRVSAYRVLRTATR